MNTETVSIGIPVRNGGTLLEGLLQQITNQTYRNIEIVISDNNSSDNTQDIATAFSEKDLRVKYFRQEITLTASENFRFVVEKSTSRFFMWAAYDDRFDLNYIDELIKPFQRATTTTVLSFSNYAIFNSHQHWMNAEIHNHDFEHSLKETSFIRLIHKNVYTLNYHIYGLLLRSCILEYSWPALDYGPDQALLFYLAERGDFVRSGSTCFYYYKPLISKSKEQRAVENALNKLKPFPVLRLCYTTAKVAAPLQNKIVNIIYKPFLFILISAFRLSKKTKIGFLFNWLGRKL